jgi:glycosyltransferase involved in cell wall biosynthesis
MIIDAYKLLPQKLKNSIDLYFIGSNENLLKDYANECSSNIYFTGPLKREIVQKYISKSNLCISASYDEGFCLPIVEAYSHGIPVIFPKLIDSYPDIYSEKCGLVVDSYTPESFAIAIESAYENDWNKNEILEFSEKFSICSISKQYLNILLNESNKKFCSLSINQIDTINFNSLSTVKHN